MVVGGKGPGQIRSPQSEAAYDTHQVVRQYLEAERWNVQEQPAVGALHPDLLISSPQGKTFLIEFKLGTEGSVHFGAIAQLVRFQDEYRQLHPHAPAGAVLVTNLRVDEPVARVARELAVKIVTTGKSDQDLGTNLMSQLAN